MALSGSIYGSTNNTYIDSKLAWSAKQSLTGNYSDVTVTLTYSRNNTGFTTSGTWVGGITINGSRTTGEKYLAISYNSDTVAISATIRVYHEVDGSKSIYVSADGGISGTSLGSTSIGDTITLDPIPRISKPTVNISTVEFGKSVTISTNRASTIFTHRLWYKYLDSGWIEITPTASVTTSYSWTIPKSLMNAIPRATELKIIIGCDTYYGSNYLGYDIAEITATVPTTADCYPVVGGIVWTKSSNEPSAWPLTQGVSQGTMAMTGVTEAYGSPLVSLSLTFAGYSSTSSSLTVPNIASSGTLTAIAKVTDARGRTSAEKKVNFTVAKYSKPQLSVIAYRSDGTGNEDTSGDYLYLKATAAVTAVSTNALKTLTLGYKRHDSTGSYETVNLTNGTARITALSSDYTWDWVVTATDVLGEITKVTANGSIPTGAVVLDILANGKGLGLGKVAESEGLSSAWDLSLPNINATNKLKGATVEGTTGAFTNITIGGVSATWIKDSKDYIVEQGTSGIWTYRKWNSGIAECWGLHSVTDHDISTAWGYLFESASGFRVNFPSGLFTGVPVANINLQESTVGILSLEMLNSTSKDSTCTIYPIRATPGVASFKVAIQAIGRWK